jgi:hypothetical protein
VIAEIERRWRRELGPDEWQALREALGELGAEQR